MKKQFKHCDGCHCGDYDIFIPQIAQQEAEIVELKRLNEKYKETIISISKSKSCDHYMSCTCAEDAQYALIGEL